jgi:hypothetical protein
MSNHHLSKLCNTGRWKALVILGSFLERKKEANEVIIMSHYIYVPSFQILYQLTDFHKMWYERYEIKRPYLRRS